MKKVFFSKPSQHVINVDEVSRYSIIGYAAKQGQVKGIMALAHGQTLGITLINGPANEDEGVPAAHPVLKCSSIMVNEMMQERQDLFDFYVFNDMEDLLKWILE